MSSSLSGIFGFDLFIGVDPFGLFAEGRRWILGRFSKVDSRAGKRRISDRGFDCKTNQRPPRALPGAVEVALTGRLSVSATEAKNDGVSR